MKLLMKFVTIDLCLALKNEQVRIPQNLCLSYTSAECIIIFRLSTLMNKNGVLKESSFKKSIKKDWRGNGSPEDTL